MIKRLTKKVVRAVAPRFVLTGYHYVRLNRQVRRLNDSLREADGARPCCDVLWRFPDFQPIQKVPEIVRLFEIVRALQPRAVCEIGAASGGTTCLFAQASLADTTLISLDIAFDLARRAAIKRFARRDQSIVCLRGDSHNSDMFRAVKDLLAGRQLDFLFIDGDHSYEGVRSDFELYSPLVREGGIIAFHDIVPDFKTRFGIETYSDVGGVPQFWAEIKSTYASVEEIIEDPEQDGYGIGVIHWDGKRV